MNGLLQVKSEQDFVPSLEAPRELTGYTTEKELIESTSTLISTITRLTGIVTLPRPSQPIFRHIEFLPLSNQRILVILVLNEHEVQNIIIQTHRTYDESELQQASNFLMTHYAGKDLACIRLDLLDAMHEDHQNMDEMMRAVFEGAEKNLQKQQSDYVLAGESNLLEIAQETGVDQLRTVLNAFSYKRDVIHLLDQCLEGDGVQIFIGQESGYDILGGCSLITAPYAVDGKVLGVLGVMGPTRMDYEKAIQVVGVTAKLLSAAMRDHL